MLFIAAFVMKKSSIYICNILVLILTIKHTLINRMRISHFQDHVYTYMEKCFHSLKRLYSLFILLGYRIAVIVERYQKQEELKHWKFKRTHAFRKFCRMTIYTE